MKVYNKSYFILLPITLFLFIFSSVASMNETPPVQKFNQKLHDQLPAAILKSKEIVAVNDGSVPPYVIYTEDNKLEGVNIDLLQAVSEILGVTIKHEKISTLSAVILGVQNGRYDMTPGPLLDTLERQEKGDFIAYAQVFSAFAVSKGNPANIGSFYEICGKKISVQSGTNLEERLYAQSKKCTDQGKAAIDIKIFNDQTSALLAVKSDRVDACFAPSPVLEYFVSLDDKLEFIDAKESVPVRYQSAMLPKNSPLGPVLLAAYQELVSNGTYQAIMKKWGLQQSIVTETGMNLAK